MADLNAAALDTVTIAEAFTMGGPANPAASESAVVAENVRLNVHYSALFSEGAHEDDDI